MRIWLYFYIKTRTHFLFFALTDIMEKESFERREDSGICSFTSFERI